METVYLGKKNDYQATCGEYLGIRERNEKGRAVTQQKKLKAREGKVPIQRTLSRKPCIRFLTGWDRNQPAWITEEGSLISGGEKRECFSTGVGETRPNSLRGGLKKWGKIDHRAHTPALREKGARRLTEKVRKTRHRDTGSFGKGILASRRLLARNTKGK